MTPFWHPLSALRLPDLPSFATPQVVRFMLAATGEAELVYAGDAMRPGVAHGQRVRVAARGEDVPAAGDVVVACPEGAPELLRVVRAEPPGAVVVQADAEPGRAPRVALSEVLARAHLPRRPVGEGARRRRRLRLDLAEALRGAPDAGDAAEGVKTKYDDQAPGYAAARRGDVLDDAVLGRIRGRLRAGGRVLVAGSGSGPECFALARRGFDVVGVDFSPAMVEQARAGAAREGVDATFVRADLRRHREPAGSLAGAVFTYDMYSLIPGAADRVAVLRNLAGALEPGGAVFLSARRVRGGYDRLVLTLQWASRGLSGEWGGSHSRWVATDGTLRRSFVRYFTDRGLRLEAARAGLVLTGWQRGHGLLEPRAGTAAGGQRP